MLLGTRPRAAMRRTTSVTNLVADKPEVEAQPADQQDAGGRKGLRRTHRRGSADFAVAETASFLMACGLCGRRLGPGIDIFIYRGEIVFCSLECREWRIELDKWQENMLTSEKVEAPPATSKSQPSGSSRTAAAA